MNFSKTYTLLLAAIIILFAACKPNDNSSDQFDRTTLLAHTADNIILVRYDQWNTSVNELYQAIQQFADTPQTENLLQARNALLTAQKNWQTCSSFEFGPAGILTLRTAVNTYPVDTLLIQQNIISGTYNLDAAGNIDAKGFPAIDYLLYGVRNTDNDILAYYTNTTSGQNRTDYLLDVTLHIKNLSAQVRSGWLNGYADDFKSRTGTDVGSALGRLVNEINLDFERYIRDGKIGIPLGIRSLGTPQPEKAEAYYSKNSLALAKESITQLKDLYLGKSPNGTSGISLDDYLRYLEAKHQNQLLADKILQQFDAILIAIDQLDGPLSEDVLINTNHVDQVYDAMQQLVILLKVDMSSSMGILITYQDNDGD